MANVYDPEFDAGQDRGGFRFKRARLSRQAGSERLGASLFALEPGDSPFPFHHHLANEEMLIAIEGRPHLRGPDGWRQLEEGELVAFPVGERGAHQIQNRTGRTVRVLILSEMIGPELTVYPDSGKVGARELPPGSGPDGIQLYGREADSLDYTDGESPPERA